jgi:hypothetical protein
MLKLPSEVLRLYLEYFMDENTRTIKDMEGFKLRDSIVYQDIPDLEDLTKQSKRVKLREKMIR